MKKSIHTAIGGLLTAFWMVLLLRLAFAGSSKYWFIPIFFVFAYFISRQESIRLQWRRIFISLSVESFLMPFAGVIGVINSVAVNSGKFAFVFGGLIAGGVIIFLLAVTGLIMGIIFLLTGLLLFKVPKRKKHS